jgi:alpha-1,3-rhamnosyl/mannosyltransferase
MVGKLTGRRNIPLLIEAFGEMRRRAARPYKLVLVGHNLLGLELAQLAERAGVADDVRHVGFVADGDLNPLYNAAEAFVSPSVYETVSLPALEAQATGTPVICVGADGMREITGGHAHFVDEMRSDLLATAMLALARDAGRRAELSARGLENARHFTWRRSSEHALDVIEEASRLPSPARRLSA